MNPTISIDHIAIQCYDKKRIHRFYEQLLQCKFVRSFVLSKELVYQIFQEDREVEVVVYEGSGCRFEIFITDKPNLKIFDHICLSVHNRKEFLESCDNLGVPYFTVKKQEKSLVFVQDDSGNLFEIKSS